MNPAVFRAAHSVNGILSEEISVSADGVALGGALTVPATAEGIVLFAHGSGSSRYSPRNRSVAQYLNGRGLATLLFDLLTPAEEAIDARTRAIRFDIALLARRLVGATDWIREQPQAKRLAVGYFGSSTGAAAALVAASEQDEVVRAVVSRGGRPDLAAEALTGVRAPTLLIVGGHDREVLALNESALAQLRCDKRLEIVPGATHLFEEPGALEQVAGLAGDWFARLLVSE